MYVLPDKIGHHQFDSSYLVDDGLLSEQDYILTNIKAIFSYLL